MTTEERIESIQEALQRRFRAAGHGSIRRVQEALSLGSGYFKDQRRPDRRRVDLRVLFRALDLLGVEPSDFFAEALGSVDPVIIFRSEAAALGRKLRPQPRILKLVAEAELLAKAAEPTAAELTDLGAQAAAFGLDELEALLDEDPKQVLRRAHELIEHLPSAAQPRLLAIYGSACRLTGRLDAAQVVLARGLDLAEHQENPEALGHLIQRAAAVAADRGQPERALALSERATLAFVKISDACGIGRCLIDQGVWFSELGQHQRAVRSFETALGEYLEEGCDAPDLRSACLQLLSAANQAMASVEDTGPLVLGPDGEGSSGPAGHSG